MRLPRLPWSKLTTPPGTRRTFPRCTLLDARSLTSGESAQVARTEALPSHRRAIFGTRTSPSCCRPSRERPAPGDSLRPSGPPDARCGARRPGGVCGVGRDCAGGCPASGRPGLRAEAACWIPLPAPQAAGTSGAGGTAALTSGPLSRAVPPLHLQCRPLWGPASCGLWFNEARAAGGVPR